MRGLRGARPSLLPGKQANNAPSRPAEHVEGKTLTKGSPHEPVTARTQSQNPVSPRLMRVRQVARKRNVRRFAALLRHITPELLLANYRALERRAAPGIDACTWESYGEDLRARLELLHARQHDGSYRAKPARRVYIDKADGTKRPLSILCLEDKIAPHADSRPVSFLPSFGPSARSAPNSRSPVPFPSTSPQLRPWPNLSTACCP